MTTTSKDLSSSQSSVVEIRFASFKIFGALVSSGKAPIFFRTESVSNRLAICPRTESLGATMRTRRTAEQIRKQDRDICLARPRRQYRKSGIRLEGEMPGESMDCCPLTAS